MAARPQCCHSQQQHLLHVAAAAACPAPDLPWCGLLLPQESPSGSFACCHPHHHLPWLLLLLVLTRVGVGGVHQLPQSPAQGATDPSALGQGGHLGRHQALLLLLLLLLLEQVAVQQEAWALDQVC